MDIIQEAVTKMDPLGIRQKVQAIPVPNPEQVENEYLARQLPPQPTRNIAPIRATIFDGVSGATDNVPNLPKGFPSAKQSAPRRKSSSTLSNTMSSGGGYGQRSRVPSVTSIKAVSRVDSGLGNRDSHQSFSRQSTPPALIPLSRQGQGSNSYSNSYQRKSSVSSVAQPIGDASGATVTRASTRTLPTSYAAKHGPNAFAQDVFDRSGSGQPEPLAHTSPLPPRPMPPVQRRSGSLRPVGMSVVTTQADPPNPISPMKQELRAPVRRPIPIAKRMSVVAQPSFMKTDNSQKQLESYSYNHQEEMRDEYVEKEEHIPVQIDASFTPSQHAVHEIQVEDEHDEEPPRQQHVRSKPPRPPPPKSKETPTFGGGIKTGFSAFDRQRMADFLNEKTNTMPTNFSESTLNKHKQDDTASFSSVDSPPAHSPHPVVVQKKPPRKTSARKIEPPPKPLTPKIIDEHIVEREWERAVRFVEKKPSKEPSPEMSIPMTSQEKEDSIVQEAIKAAKQWKREQDILEKFGDTPRSARVEESRVPVRQELTPTKPSYPPVKRSPRQVPQANRSPPSASKPPPVPHVNRTPPSVGKPPLSSGKVPRRQGGKSQPSNNDFPSDWLDELTKKISINKHALLPEIDDPKEQLYFSKKPRPTNYKPAALKDFTEKFKVPDKTTKRGGLGASVDEKLLIKQANQEHIKEWSDKLRRVNHKRAGSQTKRTPSQEPSAAQEARRRMLDFAKQVPKPKVPSRGRPRETSSARSGSSNRRMAEFSNAGSSRVSSARAAGESIMGSQLWEENPRMAGSRRGGTSSYGGGPVSFSSISRPAPEQQKMDALEAMLERHRKDKALAMGVRANLRTM